MNKRLLFFGVLLLLSSTVYPAETGKPFMSLYSSTQTGGHNSNWALAQDNRGIMYIGNGYGIQEFDGVTWRLIRISNGSFVRSFAKDSSGCIYAGSATEFGYLQADENGVMQYISLIDQLPAEDRGFNYVWSTHAAPEGIYFQARERLFRFQRQPASKDDWQIKIWRPKNPNDYFIYAFYLDQTLFIHQRGSGLMKLVGDSLMLIAGSEQFAYDRIHVMLPFSERPGTYLLGTFNRGLFLFEGSSFQPFRTEADSILRQCTLYDGKVLPDGSFGLGSLARGFMIIDTSGKLKLHLTRASGLLSNTVPSVFIDRQKNIWLGMVGGVGILENESSLTQFPIASGSTPIDIRRHLGTLYVSATDGIYYLDQKDSQFKFVSGILQSGASNALVINDQLYFANVTGVYQIEDAKGKLVLPYDAATPSFVSLYRSRIDSNRIIASALIGLATLRYETQNPNHLRLESIVPGLHEYIRQVVEPEPGIFWLSTYNAGVIRLHFTDNNINKPIIERFGPEKGLPIGITSVFHVMDRLIFGTGKGIYRFNEEQQRFEPDYFFKDVSLGSNPGECVVLVDADSNILANAGKETAFYKRMPDGSYQLEKSSFSRFADELVYTIYPESNGTVWFGTTGHAIRHIAGRDRLSQTPCPALIRCVKFANDSILYAGDFGPVQLQSVDYVIPFRLNAMTFEFVVPSYFKPAANEYQIKLEGFNQSWSAWSRDNKRNYTNLPQGRYTFQVKARNIYYQESAAASFVFTIQAPWYGTWWAYLAYVLGGGLVFLVLVRFRTRKLRERSRVWEKIVQERTAEIQAQKNNVEQLSRIGRDITDNLSIKDIINTVYENVNRLMEATVFGIGLYQPDKQVLVFPATKEKGKTLPEYIIPIADDSWLSVWCFKNREDIIINNYRLDFIQRIQQRKVAIVGESPESILYLPLQHKEKTIGVITAQSFNNNAYTEYHLNMLRNLATYCAIALENADAYRRLNELLDDLKSTQEKLVTQSKLAALGALTAGIAHEIKNPLNFVNNFAELSRELMQELEQELITEPVNKAAILDILHTLQQNANRINEHGKRADSIIRSMLQHSRGKAGERQPTDINALLEEDINLAYHGMRAQDSTFNIKIEKDFDQSIGKLEIVPQDISRVFLNIISNGCYEAHRKKLEQNENFSPTLSVSSKNMENQIEIRIRDNGNGIPIAVRDKLFTPFFTTKPAGLGTGLGLSISYDIVVHGHNGQITFESEVGEFTEFIIRLPKTSR